jgi:predicted Zn-dependent protease
MPKFTFHAYVTMLHTCEFEADTLEEALAQWEDSDSDIGEYESEEWDQPHGVEVNGEYRELTTDDEED